ncbi:MAG: hypothetical protein H7Y20_05010 [Bryobacteraceae bacterium]|nr:hypothetical protein [Bryobacteraceae bacterium]
MRANEAAALADLVFQQVEGRPITDDLRSRLAGRVPALGLASMVPLMASLVRDPLHSSAYYVAIDSGTEGSTTGLLLYLTLASAPSNQTFPRSILIGRMRPGGTREIVVSAIPFSFSDYDNISAFVDRIDPSIALRPQGSQSSLTVEIERSATDLSAAFEGFRQIRRSTGANVAAVSPLWGGPAVLKETRLVALWAAVRSGWRSGLSVCTPSINIDPDGEPSEGFDGVREMIRYASENTRFGVTLPAVSAECLGAAEEIYQLINHSKAASHSRQFDFEVTFAESASPTSADDLKSCLQFLRDRNCSVQFSAPCLGPPDRMVAAAAELSVVSRSFGATLSFTASGLDAALLRQMGRATGGRANCRISSGADAESMVFLSQSLRS